MENNSSQTPPWVQSIINELVSLRQNLALTQQAISRIETYQQQQQHPYGITGSMTNSNPSTSAQRIPTNPTKVQTNHNGATSARFRSSSLNHRLATQPGPSTIQQRLRNAQAGPSNAAPPKAEQFKAKQSRARQLLNNIAANPTPTNICWYHKQFGNASQHCIAPCDFIATIPIVIAPPVPAVKTLVIAPIPASLPAVVAPPTPIKTEVEPKKTQPMTIEQHNDLANAILQNQRSTLSDSSDTDNSSSDTDDEKKDAWHRSKQ